MTIAFTICSINYLAQARTLGESLRRTNPDITYFVGLVDRLENITFAPGYEPDCTLVEVHTIGIEAFDDLCERYNITELNTAVKPFYFQYFYETYPGADKILYLDPDIIVFQPLTALLATLDTHEAVLTPHLTVPIADTKKPSELDHLNTGLYNLGFCGFRRSESTRKFLAWWAEKLRYECLIALCDGLFVDQNWMNFLPLFVENTCIESNPGYNAAYWNLHERTFTKQKGTFMVNEGYPLQFFHFSGYDPARPDVVSKYQNRYDFHQRPDLTELFELYRERLMAHGNSYYRNFTCVYIKPEKIYKYSRIRKGLTTPLRTLMRLIDSH
ncbi:glycosyl transferase [Salmonirosea aquatica]|uniref:Glycosyl transferase n=1 Tax=Salmonirosea aquatica TaxID=2654236 RepID=A0A7C9BE41_9BACT|nr:glycosyl transferase [Cytophagaceae bacterium SJW1-29]